MLANAVLKVLRDGRTQMPPYTLHCTSMSTLSTPLTMNARFDVFLYHPVFRSLLGTSYLHPTMIYSSSEVVTTIVLSNQKGRWPSEEVTNMSSEKR